jgi:acyl-CoA hydrolase
LPNQPFDLQSADHATAERTCPPCDLQIRFAANNGLRVHSGAIDDGIAALMAAGDVENRHKEIDEGVTVGVMLMGTRRLYRFADRNPAIRLRATSYTH